MKKMFAKRLDTVEPSATLAMTARAQAMKKSGVDVLAMSAGEPDFDTPDNIKKAAHEAIDRGETKYTPVAGTAALRQAVAAWSEKFYGQPCKPSNVIVGAGGKQVLYNAAMALLDPGDEALFASPYWVSYPDMIRLTGATPIAVAGDETRSFLPQAADYAKVITKRTRLIMLNSPSNPTGAAYNRAELENLAELLRGHPEVFIVTDDIYSGLVYDAPFVSLAQVAPDLAPRTLIATGVSKTYAMTGWRIGYGIGPAALISAMSDLQGVSTSGASSIAQAAATEAVKGEQSAVVHMREVFKTRRDRMVKALRQIPKVEVFNPSGAFYVFPRISAHLGGKVASSSALCEHLLEKAHLALVPGSAFGSDDHIRMSFACSEKDIDEGVRRLQTGLAAL
jgi:aspartate aminotransferase